MPRNLSSGLITSLSGRQIRVADLIEIHLSTPIYFNTSFVDLTYDSVSAPDAGANTYLAQGQFLGLGNVQETKDLKIGTMNIAFTAVDYTTLGYVLNNEYIDRR